jgi:hypothetical protein
MHKTSKKAGKETSSLTSLFEIATQSPSFGKKKELRTKSTQTRREEGTKLLECRHTVRFNDGQQKLKFAKMNTTAVIIAEITMNGPQQTGWELSVSLDESSVIEMEIEGQGRKKIEAKATQQLKETLVAIGNSAIAVAKVELGFFKDWKGEVVFSLTPKTARTMQTNKQTEEDNGKI